MLAKDESDVGRIMDGKGHSDETEIRNTSLNPGGKAILVVKWQKLS